MRVCRMPGSGRMSCATRSERLVVAASEVPSGVRTITLYCEASSAGRKFFPTKANSGTMERTTSTLASTTVLRCAMDQVNIRVYQASKWRNRNDSLEECPPEAGVRGLINREHSMGVRVKETSSDTAMAKAEVKPNELMNRPTIPPMKPTE